MPKLNRTTKTLLELAILFAPLLCVVALWDRFPQTVAIHWNLQGVADGFAPRAIGLLLLPGINTAAYLAFLALPKLDRRLQDALERPSPSATAYNRTRIGLMLFLSFCSLVSIAIAAGVAIDVARVLPNACLLLFLVIGNTLGSLRPNYFAGIRTPWTLASPEVWRLTHRAGAKLLVFGSLALLIVQLWLPQDAFTKLFVAFVVLLAGWGFVYSHRLIQKLEEQPRATRP